MKKIETAKPVNVAARFVKLKEMLKRFNLDYEERIEGNALVIDIKAKPTSKSYAISS